MTNSPWYDGANQSVRGSIKKKNDGLGGSRGGVPEGVPLQLQLDGGDGEDVGRGSDDADDSREEAVVRNRLAPQRKVSRGRFD